MSLLEYRFRVSSTGSVSIEYWLSECASDCAAMDPNENS